MPVPPPPFPLPMDDKHSSLSSRSPLHPVPAKVVDTKPIVSDQAARDSPPPSTKPVVSSEPSKLPRSPSRSSTESEGSLSEGEEEPEEDLSESGVIDMETFQQLLELDEEDDSDFSKGMVWEYFSQVDKTFGELDQALKAKDLSKASDLGHFLKGSSAALGVHRVQAACERIQNYGHLRNVEKDCDIDKDEALKLISGALKKAKSEYRAAAEWLRDYYKEPAQEE